MDRDSESDDDDDSGLQFDHRLQPTLVQQWTFNRIFLTAGFFRLLLICYARVHDYLFQVAFTDIDYAVYTDGARFVAAGQSPYLRATYRYTPLLAFILQPNIYYPEFGKIVFCSLDLIVGYLCYRQLLLHHRIINDDYRKSVLISIAILWLFNPLTAVISARGNADVLVCAAVVATLYLLENKQLFLAALVHGLFAVQLKLYPIIYLPSIFLYLAEWHKVTDTTQYWQMLRRLMFNWRGFTFVAISLSSFALTTLLWYRVYGDKFLDESLLYHLSRTDIRHNFSPYFYLLYLTESNQLVSKFIGTCAFVPQAVLLLFSSFKYSHDLPFCWFISTLLFVSLNKVCTSQYFVWYICLAPMIVPNLHQSLSVNRAVRLGALWFATQGVWLLFAYLLEFRGLDTFLCVWLASLALLVVNLYIAVVLMRNYRPALIDDKKLQ